MKTNPVHSGKNLHIPIMVQEVIQYLNILKEGIYIDCTIGYGGHARYILEKLSSKGKLIGIDKDEEALNIVKKSFFITKTLNCFIILTATFRTFYPLQKIFKIDGMLLDLGLSSPQMNSEVRGFSYKINSDLDMRYDLSQEFKAIDLLNFKSKRRLLILSTYMVKKNALEALQIEFLKMRPIQNVYQLVEAIKISTPPKNRNKTLARVFQAVRIFVNNELSILDEFLSLYYDHLSVGGRIVLLVSNLLKIG